MADQTNLSDGTGEGIAELLFRQSHAAMTMMAQLLPEEGRKLPDADDAAHWAEIAGRLQAMWLDFQADQANRAASPPAPLGDLGSMFSLVESWYGQMPLAQADVQRQLWSEGLDLWQRVLGQFGVGGPAPGVENAAAPAPLPRSDRRFADPRWRETPFFALVHQTYLLLAEQIGAMAERVEGLEPARKQQLQFLTRAIIDALSPANFPLTNPVALEKMRETRGESLIKGMEHLLADWRRGQLTHTNPGAFELGRNIANTPGKVVHETPLYQLIQYSPVTEKVLAVPLIIFPPWINRFYILDLNPAKSFVRWAVEQGITVFMVSWKSADETMADILWDDYIGAQIEAIDVVRERLDVPSVHAVGYCVAGTTLAATLAILARRGESDRVTSATFFTAQVDFEYAGDLKNFIDDQQLEALARMTPNGFVDGRYMAAAFNLLRGNDLIWNYVEKNYLLGEDYPAFDLLHWNGDVTNLPAKWHQAYLRDLYRDNRLVLPDSLSACGTPIDLGRIETPCYIQAGREDHIAPSESVWRLTRHLAGPWTFLLAGSGHIAGVVNPPLSGKYGYWTNDSRPATLAEFVGGAAEHTGSWWSHWLDWLRGHDDREVRAKGKRRPGSKGDRVIEDAPGRYVMKR